MKIPDKNKTQPPGYHKIVLTRSTGNSKAKSKDPWKFGAIIALSSPPLGFRATVKLSEAFLHDESSITKGGYESAIVLEIPLYFFLITLGNSALLHFRTPLGLGLGLRQSFQLRFFMMSHQ